MFDYIRLTGECLVFLAAVVAMLSVPLNFCNFVTYLGTLYILYADFMKMNKYGLNKYQETE